MGLDNHNTLDGQAFVALHVCLPNEPKNSLKTQERKTQIRPHKQKPRNKAYPPADGCRQSTWHGCRLSTAMPKNEPYQNRIELIQGTLDMLILRALVWGAQHGYGIAQTIRTRSSDVLQVETGSLYPALHRLEKQGWVKSEWGNTENNQRAKFYSLTAAGKKRLEEAQGRWNRMISAMDGFMKGEA